MEFREHTLANGLEIIAECNPRAYSAAVAFFVKTGARDETDQLSGVSHFLEHMAFKGTPTRSAADVNRELDEIGASSNAYTSEELTVYYATVLPEYQERAVELLSDIMRPSLREEDFDTEKQVILEEIAKYDDQPPFGAHERIMALHFQQHPLARSVLGTAETVGALTVDQMRDYFQRRYSPGNLTLAAAGNVDFDALVRQAEQLCGAWPAMTTERDTSPAGPNTAFEVLHKEFAAQEYLVQVATGPAAEDEQRYAGRLLCTVVGDDNGSRMFWELVDTGLAEYAAMEPYEFQGSGIYMTFVGCAPDEALNVWRRVAEIQRQVEQHGITSAELIQAQNKVCSGLVLQSERPGNRLFSVGLNWVQRHRYSTVRDEVDAFRNVTCEQVADVIARFPLSYNTTIAVGPLRELAPPVAE